MSTERNKLLAKAHLGATHLGLTEEDYRSVLAYRYGKESAKDLSDDQLRDLTRHWEAKGWRPKGGKRGRRTPVRPVPLRIEDQIAKIRALWLSLNDIGELADPSPEALRLWVKRQTKALTKDGTGVDAVQWLTNEQAQAVIEHLKKWVDRVRTKRCAEELAGMPDALEILVALGLLPGPAGLLGEQEAGERFSALLRKWEAVARPVVKQLIKLKPDLLKA